ncbi:MAG TPA: FhaA domain-containing protein [Blastocatellia bacterium]|nr:FhaA domain-containing protein [Blastocatellia bacterium]
MADKNDTALDKAEGVARRILERLGSKLDSKLASSSQPAFGAGQLSDLTARIERAIESNLREAGKGLGRVAPNRFRVLLTYEETSGLTAEYMEAMGKELTGTVHEYINNRRYQTSGPIDVEVARDVFAKTIVVKLEFSGDSETSKRGAEQSTENARASRNEVVKATLVLEDAQGHGYRIALESKGSPVCIGRAAGNAVRIDDSSISRIHCSVALRASGEVVVADLASANGTFVNETPVTANEAHSLRSGDVIRLGDIALSVSGLA